MFHPLTSLHRRPQQKSFQKATEPDTRLSHELPCENKDQYIGLRGWPSGRTVAYKHFPGLNRSSVKAKQDCQKWMSKTGINEALKFS